MTDNVFLPVAWMRLERYCALTGDNAATVHSRRKSGQWIEGHHWKLAPDRRVWVHLPRAQEWVESGELKRA